MPQKYSIHPVDEAQMKDEAFSPQQADRRRGRPHGLP